MSEQVPEQVANTANVYGMEVPIVADIERGEMITDVLILSRFVMFDDDGKPFDGIIFDATPGTTHMMKMGMVELYRDILKARDRDDDD